jgi:oxygen-independent coproporphyrinogen-3 oxidase
MGVNRASLGVQDFDPAVQAAIGRRQDFATTAACTARLREISVRSVNFDLMYGLPHQTVAGVAETARRALALGPDRVAVFGYAHVSWMKRQQRLLPEAALPGAVERFRQQAAVAEAMRAGGYIPIGLDHYARPGDGLAEAAKTGKLARNFQGYTTDIAPALIGLGASAISALPQGYAQNAPDVPGYRAAITAGKLATARGVAIGAEDRMRADVIRQIMCGMAVDLDAVAARHGAAPDVPDPALARMADDGLLRREGGRIIITEAGRPFLRSVAALFDARLAEGGARHSRPV